MMHMGKEVNQPAHRVLAVFAHPDDESYGPGATLARLGAEGCEVRLITLTRGESASMGDSPLFSPEFLAETRVMELDCACIALGISSHELLAFPDKALANVPLDELAGPVIRALRDFRPHLVITFHPSGISGHPDHQSTTRAVRRALEVVRETGRDATGPAKDRVSASSIGDRRRLSADQEERMSNHQAVRRSTDWTARPVLAYYVVPESVAAKIKWRTINTVPDDEVTHAIEIGEYLESKIEAVHCHKTQRYLFEKLSEFPGGIEALWEHEYFIVEGHRSGGSPSMSLIPAT
jgi:LmbE family N-acetylglucosaminyl deacetylase